jgi:hypothetical protein
MRPLGALRPVSAAQATARADAAAFAVHDTLLQANPLVDIEELGGSAREIRVAVLLSGENKSRLDPRPSLPSRRSPAG